MKWLLVTCGIVLAYSTAAGVVPADPEFSVLWGSFRCAIVVDSFLVASTDDGLMIAEANPVTSLYDQVNHLFLRSSPVKIKRYGDVLAVRTKSDIIYIIDIGTLPVPAVLGEVDLNRGYRDFALDGQNLYIGMEYEGVWRYTLNGYTDPQFSDSSLLPIHAIQVDTRGDTLFVLDDYNGILRYSLSGSGFGQFADMLWIPLQASSFTFADSTVFVGLAGSKRVLLVYPDQSADSVTLLVSPQSVMVTDSLVTILDPAARMIEVVNRNTLGVTHTQVDWPVLSGGQATSCTDNVTQSVIYPDQRGLLWRLDLQDLLVDPTPGRVYGGPDLITDFEYFDGRLYVSQLGRPVDIFEVDPTGYPVLDTTLFSPLGGATHLDQSMGRLLTFFPPIGAVFLTRYVFDSLFLDNYLDVDTSKVNGFASNRFLANDNYTMVTWGGSRATIYELSDTLLIRSMAGVIVQGVILEAMLAREWLAVATNKGLLYVYRLNSSDALEHKATFGISRTTSSLAYDDRTRFLYVLSGDRVSTIDLSLASPTIRVEQSPLDIMAAAWGDDRMYTIGGEGIGVFARPSAGDTSLPPLIDRGGRAGSMIQTLNDLVFASDGHALHIYDLRIPTDVTESPEVPEAFSLSPNYPNPFNPSTTIEYYLPAGGPVRISVLNLLGQVVMELVDEPQTAGHHRVFWDGRTGEARLAATGIYFYRLDFNGRSETRKMLLLK